jgi:hypothetical protein
MRWVGVSRVCGHRKICLCEKKLIRNVEDLFRRIMGLPGGFKFNWVLKLRVEHFDGLIAIAHLFHGSIVVV